MTHYAKIISAVTGVTDAQVLMDIEECMRQDIFHSTLDWQTRGQLEDAAWQAAEILDLRI